MNHSVYESNIERLDGSVHNRRCCPREKKDVVKVVAGATKKMVVNLSICNDDGANGKRDQKKEKCALCWY